MDSSLNSLLALSKNVLVSISNSFAFFILFYANASSSAKVSILVIRYNTIAEFNMDSKAEYLA